MEIKTDQYGTMNSLFIRKGMAEKVQEKRDGYSKAT